MTIRSLPSSPYINLCKKPLGNPRFSEISDYAWDAVKMLVPKEVKAYSALKLNIFDGIFSGGKSVAEITAKKYSSCTSEQLNRLMSCVFLNELCSGKALFVYPIDPQREYMLLSPKKIIAELTGNTRGYESVQRKLKKNSEGNAIDKFIYKSVLKRQGELELKISSAVMKECFKNQAFVTRFNEETYFKGLDLAQLAQERLGIWEKPDILSFTILYSVSFFGLNYNDIYTVEEVFGFSDNGIRTKDSVKTNAAYALRNDLQRCSDMQLGSMLEQMGQAVFRIPLPKLNVDNAAATACRYLLYSAAAQTGKTLMSVMESETEPAKCFRENCQDSYKSILKRSELLSEYKKAAALCESISSLAAVKGAVISNSPWYSQTQELEKTVRKEENGVL